MLASGDLLFDLYGAAVSETEQRGVELCMAGRLRFIPLAMQIKKESGCASLLASGDLLFDLYGAAGLCISPYDRLRHLHPVHRRRRDPSGISCALPARIDPWNPRCKVFIPYNPDR